MADESKPPQARERSRLPESDLPEWTRNLRYSADPNRVTSLQIQSTPRTTAATTTQAAHLEAREDTPRPLAPMQDGSPEPSYYDVSLLKKPVWKWEIATYFFLGGLSAGSYVIARMAERFGGARYRNVTRAGTYIAWLSFLPCPPLLILDLGDRTRFHHMLRIFKPSSPMSLGTWAIMSYSGMATTSAIREWLRDRRPAAAVDSNESQPIKTTLLALHDAAGVPFALLVAGYTGVLLSCTANPLWTKSKWLGPLFSASAISTGAAATRLAIGSRTETPAHKALENIDTCAHIAESIALRNFLKETGPRNKPLTSGSMKHVFSAAAAGIIASEVVKRLPLRPKTRRFAANVASVLALASGFALRWAMIYGGKEAAADPHLARLASRPGTGPNGRLPQARARQVTARPI